MATYHAQALATDFSRFLLFLSDFSEVLSEADPAQPTRKRTPTSDTYPHQGVVDLVGDSGIDSDILSNCKLQVGDERSDLVDKTSHITLTNHDEDRRRKICNSVLQTVSDV